MSDRELVIGLVVGVVQGVLEWLPVSSEGNVALVLAAMGESPERVVAFALFVHLGTALSATVYYRREIRTLLSLVPTWEVDAAFDGDYAAVTFLAIGTGVSGVVGIALYLSLADSLSRLTGGALFALVGVLLLVTGVVQYGSADRTGTRRRPDALDAVVVGFAQGLAILPGISRSGMTTGALLLRGHDASGSFRLSFLLSIPAATGGGLLAYADGAVAVGPLAAALSLGVAAAVGYATIDALLRVVDEVPFWAVCIGLGTVVALGSSVAIH